MSDDEDSGIFFSIARGASGLALRLTSWDGSFSSIGGNGPW